MPTINRQYRNNNRNKNTINRKLRMKVYQSEKWKNIKNAHLMEYPICEICGKELAEDVHHIKTFLVNNSIDIEKAYDPDNLLSICKKCHGKLHSKKNKNINNNIEEDNEKGGD